MHGPKPVSRNASFSPNLQLNVHVKFAPFASLQRRGYVRDSNERDLGVHLETALKGMIIADRFPKSAVEVIVTVLEGQEDRGWAVESSKGVTVDGAGLMTILASCMTVASAALADARIDCLDLLAGGVAAVASMDSRRTTTVLDPCPSEHQELHAVCTVGYLPTRDELAHLWFQGSLPSDGADAKADVDGVVDSAVSAAQGAYLVLQEAVRESVHRWEKQQSDASTKDFLDTTALGDVNMK